MIIIETPSKTDINVKDDDPTMILDISFDEEEEMEDNQKAPKVIINDSSTFIEQETKKTDSDDQLHRVDELADAIFKELLMAEARNLFPKR